jgi:anti-anti-sigma regulatory factor
VEASSIRDRRTSAESLSFDDVESFDELLGPGVCAGQVSLSLAKLDRVETGRIGWLMAADRRFREEGGTLVVHSVWPLMMDALRFLRLDRVLHVADNEAAAWRLLRENEPAAAE